MLRRTCWVLILLFMASALGAQQTIYFKKDHVYNGPGGAEIATMTPTPSDQTAPSAPTSLSAPTVTATSVSLQWTASTSSDEVGHKIYRQLGTGASLPVGTVGGGSGTLTFTDQPLLPSTGYTYTIVAFDNAQNHSAASSSVNITTSSATGETIVPGTPLNLRGHAPTTTSVRLDWYASTDLGGSGIAGYKVYRDGNLVSGASPITPVTFLDTGLNGTVTYAYTVKAHDNAGNVSAATPALSIKPDSNPYSYSDNFNRADSSTVGSSWVERESGDVFRIVSNQLQMRGNHSSNATRGAAYWNGTFGNDQYSQIVFRSSTGSNNEVGPAVRIDPNGSVGNESMYLVKYFTSSGFAALIKTVNQGAGGGTVLGSLWYGTLANGDVLRIEATGSSITVKKNGTAIIGPVTDTTLTQGKPGVAILTDPGLPRDSYWDNWAGGNTP